MFVFDGEKRRIYEAPQGSTFITLPSGVRRYYFTNPTDAPVKTKYDVKKDLWSRSQDYLLNNPWSTIPFEALGGAIRGEDDNGTVYQSADFKLNAKEGWRIVLGDWKHEALFNGNLYSNLDDELFDLSSTTTVGSYPRINGAADLLTYISKADNASLEQIEALILKHKCSDTHINSVQIPVFVEHSELLVSLSADADVYMFNTSLSASMPKPLSSSISNQTLQVSI